MAKGSIGVVITIVVVALVVLGYFFLLKKKMDEQRVALKAEVAAQEAQLQQIEVWKADSERMKLLLPRWKEQYQIFRAAIPVTMEDDVFLRNLQQQMRQNGVRLMSVELSPAGQWFPNLNEIEEANYIKENVNPAELRRVRVANFSVSLMGDFGNVLRAFENLKLYGRVYALDRIVGPAGGGGGAVFVNEDDANTPIQVSGRIFYGLSENFLSQETLDKYFGRAEALGAAAAVYDAAITRAEQLSINPTSVPSPTAGAVVPPPAAPPAGTPPAAVPDGGAAAATDSSAKADSKQRVAQSGQRRAPRQQAAGG